MKYLLALNARSGENNVRNFVFQASTIDGRRKGACLFCQEYFMDLYLLAELKTISLKVTTVDMQKPPPDFRTNFQATPPPILIDNGDAILENEKIERHIMKNIPGGYNLFVQDKDVATLVENLFSVSFVYFILS
jgi:chloride intracellular channel protein 2